MAIRIAANCELRFKTSKNRMDCSEGKKHTPKVFSALKPQVPQQQKRGLVCVFKGKRRKIHIHQRASKVFVGDPFAQFWCIDFGLLIVHAVMWIVGAASGILAELGSRLDFNNLLGTLCILLGPDVIVADSA